MTSPMSDTVEKSKPRIYLFIYYKNRTHSTHKITRLSACTFFIYAYC